MLKLLLAIGLAGCGFSGYLLYHDVFVLRGSAVVGTALMYGGFMLLVGATALGLVRSRPELDDFPDDLTGV